MKKDSTAMQKIPQKTAGADNLLTMPATEVEKAADAAAFLPVAEAIADAQALQPGRKPDFLPDKFWDLEAGQVRLEDLAKSYRALEQRMSGAVVVPGPDASPEEKMAFHRARGVPEAPDGYQIAERHPLLAADPDLNALLHSAGFTPDHAQLVYDLAADRVLPVIENLASEFEADRQLVRLVDHFGGEERWAEVRRQVLTWGRANLPGGVMGALATTFEGVVALHGMMTSGEPTLRAGAGQGEPPLDEDGVKTLMRDPRYWRDRDPALVRKVGKAFERLYPGE
jgi:hypothetical protein